VATFYTSCPSSVSQRAALAALAQPARTYDRMVEAFRRRRELAVAMLREVPGVRVEPPPGSFYLFPDLGEICDDTERFA